MWQKQTLVPHQQKKKKETDESKTIPHKATRG